MLQPRLSGGHLPKAPFHLGATTRHFSRSAANQYNKHNAWPISKRTHSPDKLAPGLARTIAPASPSACAHHPILNLQPPMTQQVAPSLLAKQQQPHRIKMHLQLQQSSAGSPATSPSASTCSTTTSTTTCSPSDPSSSSPPSSYPAVLSLRRQLYGPNTSLMFDQVRIWISRRTPRSMLSSSTAPTDQPGMHGSTGHGPGSQPRILALPRITL